jgi:hypothetical protein
MRLIILFFLLNIFTNTYSQTEINKLFDNLSSKDFSIVLDTKDEIINLEQESIPKLLEMLNDTTFVKLENTADLIYPGATEFFGHGYIVNYDIDWLCVRAAWLLEKLTFQDFGYLQSNITEDKLMELIKSNYTSEYLKKGTYEIDYKDTTEAYLLKKYRKQLSIKVYSWWIENEENWNRFDALKEALKSNNTNRQRSALHYLRFEKTECAGLTKQSYDSEIKNIVEELVKNGKDGVEEQARLLLRDEEYYWLKRKTKK